MIQLSTRYERQLLGSQREILKVEAGNPLSVFAWSKEINTGQETEAPGVVLLQITKLN